MDNHHVTPEENYDLICQHLKKLVDIVSDETTILTQEQLKAIEKNVGQLNQHLDSYAKKFKRSI